jgi:nicotinamidase-related amidase
VSAALVIVDIQRDYFAGGRMPLDHPEAAAEAAGRILSRFRAAGRPVVHIRHESLAPSATFLRPGTNGVQFHQAVEPREGEPVITKHHPNAFLRTPLHARITELGVTDLVVVGMMTHMCIDTTVRAASDMGYRVTVAGDATATRALSHGGVEVSAPAVAAAYLAALNGSFARVTSADLVE